MQLMPKKAINANLQDQQRSQAEEGSRLARKIDELRETLVSLEKQHKDFVAGMQRNQQEMAAQMEAKLHPLRQEIALLEARREALLRPIDDEWASLHEAQSAHAKDVESFVTRETELKEFEDSIYQRERGLSMRESRVRDDEIFLENDKIELDKKRQEVLKLVVTTTQERQTFIEERDETNRQLVSKTDELNGWASSLDKRSQALDVREDDLYKREKLLKDREAMLDRNIIRKQK